MKRAASTTPSTVADAADEVLTGQQAVACVSRLRCAASERFSRGTGAAVQQTAPPARAPSRSSSLSERRQLRQGGRR